MKTEIDVKELIGKRTVNPSILESIKNLIIRDKYRMSLGEVISIDPKTLIARVDIYDEIPKAFLKALKNYIIAQINMHKDSDYKKQALKAAKDFYYDDEIIHRIENAKSDNEVSRIMKEARKEKFG